MKIAAVCSTFLRPKQLGHLVHCFLEQDYPGEKRELLVLDDAGQYDNQQGDGWRLISMDKRFATLGEKRNAAVALVSDDVEALAVWDDDDLYLPWSLRTCVEALRIGPWSRPSVVLHYQQDGSLTQHETGGLFHGGWAYSRKVFEQVGGYPAMNNGEDQGFARRLQRAGIQPTDPMQLGSVPFYVYAWGGASGWHLSGLGPDGYGRLGEMLAEKIRQESPAVVKTPLEITPPPNIDLRNPRVLPGVFPRKF
jgi:hypothetical protein